MNKPVKNFFKAFGILSAVALAAGLVFAGKKEGTLKSTDNRFTYTIPKDWENIQGELNPAAIIELADRENVAYLVAIPYAKKNFSGLNDFHKHGIAQLKQAYDNCVLNQSQAMLLNTRDARIENGTLIFDEEEYDFKLFSVDQTDVFLFIMAWSPCEHAHYIFPEIEKIVYSIKRI